MITLAGEKDKNEEKKTYNKYRFILFKLGISKNNT
jgi:hypothetical protein